MHSNTTNTQQAQKDDRSAGGAPVIGHGPKTMYFSSNHTTGRGYYNGALQLLSRTLDNIFYPVDRLQGATDLLVQELITADLPVQADTLAGLVAVLAEIGAGDMLRAAVLDRLNEEEVQA